MNGSLMYELARQRIAEQQQRMARETREAHVTDAGRGGRGKRRGLGRADEVDAFVIPDFPQELLGGSVPGQRQEASAGRARTRR